MAKVYSAPKEVKVPVIDFRNMKAYNEDCERYEKELKELLQKRNPDGELVGEIIRFPVADGYARYMVAGIKPVELVHLPLDDAWHFQYANRITAKDIRDQIKQQKAIAELFAKKRAEQKKEE